MPRWPTVGISWLRVNASWWNEGGRIGVVTAPSTTICTYTRYLDLMWYHEVHHRIAVMLYE